MTCAYVESSAAAKLVLDEEETSALRDVLARASDRVASELVVTEVSRAAARVDGDRGRARARGRLLALELVPIDRPILDRAAGLDPVSLRSLDAIHVATALALEVAELVFYAYDRRTVEAAEANGLTVASPGV